MTSRSRRAVAVIASALALGACSTPGDAPSAPAGATSATSVAPTPSPTAGRVRVSALMKKAGCKGKVIGTQMYSRETGRCNLASGGEITIATFNTKKLRDEWVKFGADFGGNFAIGAEWAAWAQNMDDAQAVADKLAGRVL